MKVISYRASPMRLMKSWINWKRFQSYDGNKKSDFDRSRLPGRLEDVVDTQNSMAVKEGVLYGRRLIWVDSFEKSLIPIAPYNGGLVMCSVQGAVNEDKGAQAETLVAIDQVEDPYIIANKEVSSPRVEDSSASKELAL
ncbi:hypothetical protein ACH5RR_006822 [Cinchona calisaya]|uniref:Uncharacterized protein n=1 Tax=Cinchona calisaya TaxID=153742 RepID=A0ABD3AQE9_9GENT